MPAPETATNWDCTMLRCREVARLSHDFIDDELDFGARLRVRLHLLACRHCRRFVGQMRATVRLLSDSAPESGPVGTDLLDAYKARMGPGSR